MQLGSRFMQGKYTQGLWCCLDMNSVHAHGLCAVLCVRMGRAVARKNLQKRNVRP